MIEQNTQDRALEGVVDNLARSVATLTAEIKRMSVEMDGLRAAQELVASRATQPPPPPPQSLPPPPVPQLPPSGPFGHPSAPPAATMQSPARPPQPPVQQQQIISPRPVLAPSANAIQQSILNEDIEEVFLNAFSSLSEPDLVQFVMSRFDRTGEYLPVPGQGSSPLSQAVLLTLVHRVSKRTVYSDGS